MSNRPVGLYVRYLEWLAAHHRAIDKPPSDEDEARYWREKHAAEAAKDAVLRGER